MNENALEFLQHFLFQRIQTAFPVILGFVPRTPWYCQLPSKEKAGARATGRRAAAAAPGRWRSLSGHQPAAQSPGRTASAESFPVLPPSLLPLPAEPGPT